MSIKVAINGFGRIGRLALRQIIKTEGLEVVAVNDLTPADMLLHLFKYDTTQGRFQGTAELKDNAIVVDGKEIKVFADADPEALPWGELGVDVVLECTGFFFFFEKAEKHIKVGGDFRPRRRHENRGVWRERRYSRRQRNRDFCRFLHHQLPGADGRRAAKTIRRGGRPDDHHSCLHRRPKHA